MVKKAHVLSSISLCAFLLCSCNFFPKKNPGQDKPHEHTYVLINAKEASFYEDGSSQHYICSGCNKTFDMNKVEKNSSEFITRIPLFETLNRKDPISLKGKEFSVVFNESEVQSNIDEGIALAEKIDQKKYYSSAEVQNFSNKNNSLRESAAINSNYADLLADFNANSEGYDLKNKIESAKTNLKNVYYKVFVAVAKEGRYNNIFFASYDDQALQKFINDHSSNGGGTGQQEQTTQQKIDTLLNNYKAGRIDRYSALSQYVGLAKQLASEKNKASYLDLAYEQNGREYTVSQADQLSSLVKTYIKPLAQTLLTKYNEAKQNNMNSQGERDLKNHFFGENMDLLRNYAKNLGEPYKSNFQNFFEEGHYFFSNIVNNNVTGYTAYSQPLGRYVFLSKNYQDLMTLTHEFGHYNAQEVYGSGADLDLSEVQSNGNEIMLLSYMKNHSEIDENVLKTFTYDHLFGVANTVLLGCAVNEFEKYIYNNDFDEQSMEAKWLEIVDDYGASIGRDKFDYLYQVVLNYRGYYISYAVSSVAALELYQKGIENFDEAAQSYKSIYTKDSTGEKLNLSLENARLGGVFETSSYTKLSQLGNI